MTDRAGNRRAYGRDGMPANGFSNSVRVQALTDTTPPVIEPVSAAPSSLDVRDSDAHVPLRLRATDAGAGVARVWVSLHGPYGDTPVAAMRLVSGTPADGVLESGMVVPRCGTRSGTYLLTAVAVDRARARRYTGWVDPSVDVIARDNEAPTARALYTPSQRCSPWPSLRGRDGRLDVHRRVGFCGRLPDRPGTPGTLAPSR